MRYSKLFHVEGEEAEDFIQYMNENSVSSLMNVLESSVEYDWNDECVYSSIPNEDFFEQYNKDGFTLAWEEENPTVCLYISSDSSSNDDFDYFGEETEYDEGQDIVTEALDDEFISSIRKLQEGDISDFEISVAKRAKELTIKYMNGELK